MDFNYTVASGDVDTDGIFIGENKLTLNGATIRDGDDRAADLHHEAVPADSGHKVDGVAPAVSSISITSDPREDETYELGDIIEVTVTFNEDVEVGRTAPQNSPEGETTSTPPLNAGEDVARSAVPMLELDIGGSAKNASYSSASGLDVVYNYTVASGDEDTDGVAIGADKLTVSSDTGIKDLAGNIADLSHDAVEADSGHLVAGSDTTAPEITSLSFTSNPGTDWTYGTGDTIKVTVTFSENVTVTGTPELELDMYESSPSARDASYSEDDSADNDVVFTYTVSVGDSASDGLAISANKLSRSEEGQIVLGELAKSPAMDPGLIRGDVEQIVKAAVTGTSAAQPEPGVTI